MGILPMLVVLDDPDIKKSMGEMPMLLKFQRTFLLFSSYLGALGVSAFAFIFARPIYVDVDGRGLGRG